MASGGLCPGPPSSLGWEKPGGGFSDLVRPHHTTTRRGNTSLSVDDLQSVLARRKVPQQRREKGRFRLNFAWTMDSTPVPLHRDACGTSPVRR